jgi:hypothetical protein
LSWLDATIAKASTPVIVNVAHLGLEDGEGGIVQTLEAQPLSVGEYQALKADPSISKLSGEDKQEALGLRMAYEMLAKCDSTLSWGKWKQLPLNVLAQIAGAVVEAVGSPSGGGVLGE